MYVLGFCSLLRMSYFKTIKMVTCFQLVVLECLGFEFSGLFILIGSRVFGWPLEEKKKMKAGPFLILSTQKIQTS